MPITIYPSTHSSSPINLPLKAITSPLDHLTRVSRRDAEQCQTLLQSSFTTPLNGVTYPSQNGFVHAAIIA
ncbi:hypothetical protein JMJ35_004725 [Cladonia borealis]|uniref:Uncharacterized protein n=1 Tax=Cladonia borealis TaxID=184061 RepID=A0AA39R3K5_9LECA|nr:hypothetical protein JMJ35_004725 [Cladonia borealis]